MVNKKLREYLAEKCDEQSLIFNEPEYDCAIIGTCGNRVVYDFEKMVDSLSKDLSIDRLEAIEFIEYNSLRSLQYQNQDIAPLIIDVIPEEVFEDEVIV